MKNKILLILLILFLISNCLYTKQSKVKIEIKNKIYTFELASTREERKKGLMLRKKLASNSGMLFVYPNKTILSFYMKNTLIPLDIAFITSDLKIIEIRQMYPLDETSITSSQEAQYALEVNRGFFDKVGLKAGDKINILTSIIFSNE
ncbi:MAG: DUF192 domain-containing protein [Spirochaetes bacterium]|nr:DUF192 domain-containing protein [Spirochaetota bacterium]